MKRVITVLMICMLLVPAFATSKPSVDGRAVVADEGVLPRGLFAKTVGYLPGDSVSVTNPATGVTINVLVLGSVDPSTGIAILLSPEAADKLFITKNTNVQVKITKRTGLLDETAAGSAVISLDPDKNSAASVPDDIKNTFASVQAEADAMAAEQTAAAATSAAAAAVPEPETQPAEAAALIAETDAGQNEAAAQIITETAVSDISDAAESIPAEVLAAEEAETADSTAAIAATDEAADSAVIADTAADTVIPSVIAETAPGQNEAAAQIITETAVSDISDAAESIPAEVRASEEAEPPAAESAIAAAAETAVTASAVTVPADPVSTEDELDLFDPFAPIILIPAEKNPPEVPAVQPETKKPIVISPEPVNPPAQPAPIPDTKQPPAKEKTQIAGTAKIIPDLADLKSGSYYIQIATLSQADNINTILETYGKKYPIVLVPLKSGTAYQVMVGPLSVDEYGTVLARFKSYGYKDAFLRKIK